MNNFEIEQRLLNRLKNFQKLTNDQLKGNILRETGIVTGLIINSWIKSLELMGIIKRIIPIKDLEKTNEFFTAIEYNQNPDWEILKDKIDERIIELHRIFYGVDKS